MFKTPAPLYETLLRHWEKKPRSFHVPGHRFGEGVPSSWLAYYDHILRLDVTELSDTDNLHQAEGAIREAQRLAADCFGAEETHFLVGGSTAGNQALILALCAPGETILVQRNVHRSVLHGLMLAGASAVFLSPQEDEGSGVATVPSLATIEEALHRYPEAKALLLTNPNYYGMSVDLKPYADAAHQKGIPLLVDEAHGAHYGLHPAFPPSALSQGADAAVQSTHKTLTAMTMGAMLHLQGSRIHRGLLARSLAMVQSSSPSYPIMASLDIARAMIEENGSVLFEPSLKEAHRFRELVATRLPEFELLHTDGSCRLDPLRPVIRSRTPALSGYRLLSELEHRGCWAEMADEKHVVLLFGMGVTQEDTNALAEALEDISVRYELSANRSPEGEPDSDKRKFTVYMDRQTVSEPVTLSRNLPEESETESIPLEQAAGRFAAETIAPYPPGIPLLYPGERITGQAVYRLTVLSDAGAACRGAADPTLRSLRVYAGK